MKNEMLEKVLNAHKNLIVEGDVASGKTTNVLFPIVENAIDKKESLSLQPFSGVMINFPCFYLHMQMSSDSEHLCSPHREKHLSEFLYAGRYKFWFLPLR